MKNKKGFTLIELIIVIAILAIIMLIGTAAYSSIQERMKVRADKATAAQIGKAIKIRETDVGEENGIGLYPEIIEYDEIPGIGNYIAEEIKPQSMEDGNFVATAFQTQTGKKIVVGIGKKVDGETNYSINGKVYNKKDESGWAWSEDTKIEEFLKDESVSGSISSGGTTAIIANKDVALGAYITYAPTSEEEKTETYTVLADDSGYTKDQTFTPGNTTSWRVLKNNNGQLDIISTASVGSLRLEGDVGYVKAVYTLNELCKQYKNETYATGARAPGYVEGSSCEIINTGDYPITRKNTGTNGNNGFPYQDTLYSTDVTQISIAGLRFGTDSIWLASRYLDTSTSHSHFCLRYLNRSSNIVDTTMYSADIYDDYDGTASSIVDWHGVAPIISLKSGIKITGGEGTSTSPYTISIN